MYQMINEVLRIATCKLGDVPEKFGNNITGRTFFYYDKNEDIMVFIEEREDIEYYIQIAEIYLQLPRDKRKKLMVQNKDFFDSIEVTEMFIIWESVVEYRENRKIEDDYKELKRILGKTKLEPVFDHMNMINMITKHEEPDRWQWTYLFLYGYIMGKRAERSRRKKVQA
ncbi:hypothetical protein [Anaerosporobacter faecicola]|uniref:hypothetical protein n=1 Tax=Anaerosporobacter faecicola TaxID=2718714 RepID=UPI00143A0AA6|nr:hypothetical protein [Anaerosporobacter faecicola]